MLDILVLSLALAAEPAAAPPAPPPPAASAPSTSDVEASPPPETPAPAAATEAAPRPAEPAAAPAYPTVASAADAVTLLARALDARATAADRAAAVDELGKSGDDRLVRPLAYLLNDRVKDVRVAAARALAGLKTDAAQAALAEAVKDSGLPFDAREEAVRALDAQALPTAGERLKDIATNSALPLSLQNVARDALKAHHADAVAASPALAAPIAPPPAVDQSGQVLFGTASALYGSYTLYTVGKLGETDVGKTLGVLGGLALGGTAGFLLGKDFTTTKAVTLSTATGLGLWAGVAAGFGALGPNAEGRFVNLFAVGGEAIGLTAAALTYPSLKPYLEPEKGGTGGGAWTGLAGALLGGATLHLAGQLPSYDDIETLGLASGVVLGGAAGGLLGRQVDPDRAGFMASGTFWGGTVGALASRAALGGSKHFEVYEALTLASGAGGLALSGLLFPEGMKSGDVVVANAAALAGAAAGLGAVNVPEPKDRIEGALWTIAGTTAVGFVGGTLLAPHLTFSRGDGNLVALGIVHGLFAGLAVPGVVERSVPGRHHAAGALLGAVGGLAVSTAITQFTEVPVSDGFVLYGGDLFASLAGLGGGLLATPGDSESPAPNLGYLLGGTLALAAGSQVASTVAFSGGDLALVGLTSLLGTWQGLGLTVGLERTDRQVGGGALLGFGAGGLAGMLLAQPLDLSPTWVAAAATGPVWGAWITGFTLSQVKSITGPKQVLIVLGASDAGLALTTILMLPAVGVTPKQIAITSLGGVAGATFFTLGRGVVPGVDGDSLIRANLIGTGVGLLAGGLVAGLTDLGKDAPKTAEAESGYALGSASALLPRFEGLGSSPLVDSAGRMDGMAMSARFTLQ